MPTAAQRGGRKGARCVDRDDGDEQLCKEPGGMRRRTEVDDVRQEAVRAGGLSTWPAGALSRSVAFALCPGSVGVGDFPMTRHHCHPLTSTPLDAHACGALRAVALQRETLAGHAVRVDADSPQPGPGRRV